MKPEGWGTFSLRLGIVLVCVLAGQSWARSKYSGGRGTAANPWVLQTPADLAALAADANDWGSHFVQSRAIDMLGHPPIGPIGTSDVPFTGTYDGRGFTLQRVMVLAVPQSRPGGDGLFGVVQAKGAGVAIQNLLLEGPVVLGASADTGGLVGLIKSGILWRCGVKSGYVSGTVNTGGLAGQVQAEAAVRECHSSAYVLGAEKIGGLVGLNAGVVEDCYARSNTLAQWGDWPALAGSVDLGGLVGCNHGGWIATSYTDCDRILSRSGPPLPVNAGGLVGQWLPVGPPAYLFVPGNYASKETQGLPAVGNNAIGAPNGADLALWNNLVVTAVPSAWLRQKSTFKNWDFNYIWTISSGNPPRLRWE